MTVTRGARVERAPVRTWLVTAPGVGLMAAMLLAAVSLLVPVVFQWHVHANSFAPLSSRWQPRLGPGTLPAVVLAIAAVLWARRAAARARWRVLLGGAYVVGLAWLLALATVDGRAGLADQLGAGGYNDYLSTARNVDDIPALLHGFIARIPDNVQGAWPTHVAGHPPGALLFFVLLVRLGLGSGLAAGVVVTMIAATVPVAVLLTLRRLGAESAARRAAPFLVLGPAAIWSAVSADAVFAACVAWLLCLVAFAATSTRRIGGAVWAFAGGVLLGVAVLFSYGLALAAVLVVGVLVAARAARPIPWIALGAIAVVLAFAASGFVWWRALPVLHDRYYAGLAHDRPATYWTWGDLGALVLSAGTVVGVSIAIAARRRRSLVAGPQVTRVVVAVVLAAAASVALADASLMSKAEVERIWLPFVPWLLVGAALLPARWWQRAFVGQVATALALQTLLFTHW